MSIIKTEALIIRVMDYLESSRIVTCYSGDHGKISLLAKGARRAKSRFGGALDILQHVSIVYYQKETRELQTLSQAEIIYSFQSFQENLQRLAYGLAVAELLDKFEMVKAPNSALFTQALLTLHSLEKATLPELLFYHFLWHWLELSGFRPKLRRCRKCGNVPHSEYVQFRLDQGGFICAACYGNYPNSFEVSVRLIHLLLYLREKPLNEVAGLSIAVKLLSELREFSWRFLHFHSEQVQNLKTLNFLKRIRNNYDVNEEERSHIYAAKSE